MSECPKTSDVEKCLLKEEYHARKRADDKAATTRTVLPSQSNHRGSLRRLGPDAIDSHSSVFSASFLRGVVESMVLADQGSDGNMMSPTVFGALIKSNANLKVETLDPPHSFKFLDQTAGILCYKRTTADVELRIRHESKFVLRKIKWHMRKFENGIHGHRTPHVTSNRMR